MRPENLCALLAEDRGRFERLVASELGDAIAWEDAQDIVSDALVKVHGMDAERLPEPGHERGWFERLVRNQGIDFLRARHGRPRTEDGTRRAFISLTRLQEAGVELPSVDADSDDACEALDLDADRARAEEVVTRVLEQLEPDEVRLVKLRWLLAEGVPRDRVAAKAGLTLGAFRWRFDRAWEHFVEAVAAERPTEHCGQVRLLMGQIAGGRARTVDIAEIDAHCLACPACRVFARDSYRALQLLPLPPAGKGVEQMADRVAAILDRSPEPTVVAGGTAAAGGGGAGIAGLLTAGGTAGALKGALAVCSATVVTASVCGGVALIVEGLRAPAEKPPTAARAHRPITPKKVAVTPVRETKPQPSRPAPQARASTAVARHDEEAPSPAPAGSQEFVPAGSSQPAQPAPAPTTGGGEFTP